MTNPIKRLGVIVGVDGSISQVGMYSMSMILKCFGMGMY